MPLAALCTRHSSADFTICMCEFDFRQAQAKESCIAIQGNPKNEIARFRGIKPRNLAISIAPVRQKQILDQ